MQYQSSEALPKTMPAVVCHGPRDYRLEEWRVPEPAPGEVVVKVDSVGICASDLKCYLGAALFWGDANRVGYAQPPIIPGHEFVGTVVALGTGAGEKYGLALGDTAVAVWFLGLGLWQLVQSTILMWFLDGGIRRVLAAQGETSPPFAATVWLRLVAVVFVNQVVNLAAVVAACFTRTVSWRGVRYRVDGPWDVTMLDYRPYRETTAAVELPAETGSVGV